MSENKNTSLPRYMSLREFREIGLLQEINRRLLHPIGLALEMVVEEDGSERFGGVWDYRDDTEGMYYADPPDGAKAARVDALLVARRATRKSALGYHIQPPGAVIEKDEGEQ